MFDEYPHDITFLVWSDKVSDGGGGYLPAAWTVFDQEEGFLDTPSSRQVYEAHQRSHQLDRNLYFPYRSDITPGMRVQTEFGLFELIERPQDQGGQQEVMMVGLREVHE